MAGVNANLLDYGFDATKCDGILTAKELSWQKLGNVKMIILSACQTGLGYVTDDGVYGLQRGLKASGVGAMALSLWSVDDLATCELMRRFYKELVSQASNPDIYKAFMSARTSLIKSAVVKTRKFSSGKLALQQKSYRFNKPQYTNAFILIDVL
jgi:CHAT domain-containing protein